MRADVCVSAVARPGTRLRKTCSHITPLSSHIYPLRFSPSCAFSVHGGGEGRGAPWLAPSSSSQLRRRCGLSPRLGAAAVLRAQRALASSGRSQEECGQASWPWPRSPLACPVGRSPGWLSGQWPGARRPPRRASRACSAWHRERLRARSLSMWPMGMLPGLGRCLRTEPSARSGRVRAAACWGRCLGSRVPSQSRGQRGQS